VKIRENKSHGMGKRFRLAGRNSVQPDHSTECFESGMLAQEGWIEKISEYDPQSVRLGFVSSYSYDFTSLTAIETRATLFVRLKV
jgi:hypothetical protein